MIRTGVRKISLAVLWATLGGLIVACGVKVETGRNTKIKRNDGTAPENASGNPAGDPGSAGGLEGAGFAPKPSSCFGTSDDQEQNHIADRFCREVRPDDVAHFAKFHDLLCVRKTLRNLFLPQCGWDGQGEPRDFLTVPEHTAIDAKEVRDFHYVAAYSLTLAPSSMSLKEILFAAYSNPVEFRKKFSFPSNTTVVPDASGIQIDGPKQTLQFDMDIAGSVGSIRFTNLMYSYPLSSGEDLIFERDLVVKSGLNRRNVLHFAFKLPDQRNKVIVLEEFEVPDNALHDVALSVLRAHNLGKMELFYENSKRAP